MSIPQEPREALLEALRGVDHPLWLAQVGAVLRAYQEREGAARALGVQGHTLAVWLADEPVLRAILEHEV